MEATNPTQAAVETTKKKRRGISNETRSVSNLKFHEKDAIPSGLFVGIVESVRCGWATIGADSTGMGSFAGQAIPRFEMHFTSIHENVAQRRHVTLTLNPVESTVETYVNGEKSWQVDRVLGYIKHILEVFYLNGRNLTEDEEDALSLSYDDCDNEGQYAPVEVEDVIKGWQVVFENAAAMLNGTFATKDKEATGKPCYKDNNGKETRVFMKLLRFIKTGRGSNAKWSAVGNNGDLAFPQFVGEGVLEKFKTVDAVPQILRLNPLTESITPKQVEEKKAPSMPGNIPGAMPGMGGVAMAGGFNPAYDPNSGAAAATVSDMPF